ncbi:hypothetical protein [Halomarina litorea]|uniref:hypothetical protein n=1 Tax=Halomarina litorea TaxID=2961595 RepID=UPI0020C3D8C4|nr:hypothetical protein [Halomarina sp. BCD28]
MAREFTDDDRDKDVYTSTGHRVGSIGETRGQTATVRRDHDDDDDGIFDEIKDMLGWNDDDDEHELRSEDVDRHEDDGVYLRKHN